MKDDQLIPYAKNNGLEYTLEELLRLMDENGVYSGLLLSPPLKDGTPVPNKKIIEICEESKRKLLPVITVSPTKRSVAGCIQAAKKNKGFAKAFKILLGYFPVHPTDRVFEPIYNYAESSELPVLFHTGDTATVDGSLRHSHPLALDELANARPSLKIVACHFGNPWIEDVAELIYKHPNVYADISGLFTGGSKYSEKYEDKLARRLSEAIYFAGGASKVIFGTDYPVESYPVALDLVRKLEVDESDKERILFRNAEEVFSLRA
jgi:predicted TIM-barrel fold metal-dependent hydrolase